MKNRNTKERNTIKLADRFAKYSQKVFIIVNVNELMKDTTYMAKSLLDLLDEKINNFKWHIKYCEHIFNVNELTFEEKSFLARVCLIKNKNFLFQINSITK